MPNSKIEITFIAPFVIGTNIKFKVNGVELIETFVANRNAPFEVQTIGFLGSLSAVQVSFMYSTSFNLDYNTIGQFTTLGYNQILTIETTSPIVNFSDFETTSNCTAVITNTYEPLPEPTIETPRFALVRSTYSVRIIPNIPFTTCNLELFVWNGDKNTPLLLPAYSLSKPVVQLGQSIISFDINHLVKEQISNSIGSYMIAGIQSVLSSATCWAKYTATCSDIEEVVYVQEGLLLCSYGYGYFSEGFNPLPPTMALITGIDFTIYKGQDYRVYFQTTGLLELQINGEVVELPELNTDLNYEMVASLNLKEYTTADTIAMDLQYSFGLKKLDFTVKEECKYEVINCVFINKYGFPQSLFLNKVSKYTDDVDSEEYRGLTANFGVYDTTKHQFTNFNLNGRTAIVCNTDYLNENENEVVKQMLLSEKKWFIQDGIIYPVNLESKSVSYKTHLNDKLIQYTLNFKYSFEIINQVQ